VSILESAAAMTREVWFKLVDAEGDAVALSADCVDCDADVKVFRFRDAVKLKFADSHLAGMAPSDLTVFAHQEAFDAKQPLPKASSPVTDLGKDEEHPLIVAVPTQRQVVAPPLSQQSVIDIAVKNNLPEGAQEELEYYKEQGKRIRMNCAEYCEKVLDQIDKFYAEKKEPFPFMCVEGSSGMGKSQLSFALGGRRP
jgi:hypothetical protein